MTECWDENLIINAYNHAIQTLNAEDLPKLLLQNEAELHHRELCHKDTGSRLKSDFQLPDEAWTVGSRCQAVRQIDSHIYDAQIIHIDTETNQCWVRYLDNSEEEEKQVNQLIPAGTVPMVRHDSNIETGANNEFNLRQLHHNSYSSSQGDLTAVTTLPIISHQSDVSNNQNAASSGSRQYNYINTANNQNRTTSSSANNKRQTSFCPQSIPSRPPVGPSHTSTSSIQNSKNQENSPQVPHPKNIPSLPSGLNLPVAGGNSDALKSMLMSWYLCGYHTGYFEGFKASEGNKK